ncbi:MAG TPA: sugar phosphate isomerase/epimerase [Bryobacteraceae bacterium]|nr:sugar phosphate isomerase/epimerase [Bryobacteraceae bacterium]
MLYTRRDIGKLALASIPASMAFGASINSKFGGVQIGAITYSFRSMNDAEAMLKAYVEVGLGEMELMSNDCESLAGAPKMPNFGGGRGRGPGGPGGGPGNGPGPMAAGQTPPAGQAPAGGATGAPGGQPGGPGRGRGGRQLTPEQQAERDAAVAKLADWRKSANAETWKAVRKRINDDGITLAVLCYNMQDSMKDDDIEYGFEMAKGLGVKAISTSTTLTMAKRIAPIADKHKLMVGYHGHDATSDPNQTATLESYDTLMAYGKYNGINLDIGHFTASNYDAVAFIKQHHDKITNLHLKDRKKDHGPNTPWGQGDTPIKAVLQLLKENHYPFPANIEMEYTVPEGSTIVEEMKKCLAFAKDCLA